MSKHQDSAPNEPTRGPPPVSQPDGTPTSDAEAASNPDFPETRDEDEALPHADEPPAPTTGQFGGDPHASETTQLSATTIDVERVCVVGGDAIGRAVATVLADAGLTVALIEDGAPADANPESSSTEPTDGSTDVSTTAVDSISARVLAETGVDDDTVVLALHPRDETNLLVTQHARTRFDPDRIIARVNDPDRIVAYDDLDVDTLDVATTISRTVAATL